MKILETHPITQEILIEVLQLAIISGERLYVENNSISIIPNPVWKKDHMETGTYWSNKIKEKLGIDKNRAIRINYAQGVVEVTNMLSKNVKYSNNFQVE